MFESIAHTISSTLVETVRGLVRPAVTIGVVYKYLEVASDLPAEAAVAAVGTPAGIIVGFWFNDRVREKVLAQLNGNGHDALPEAPPGG